MLFAFENIKNAKSSSSLSRYPAAIRIILCIIFLISYPLYGQDTWV